ncbi:MAG TPA: glycosyltransferase [Vineibacter sp.]|nr:glycosyltransferase [Vineibacter sp.]
MASFNHEAFVATAARSVLDQSFTDLELIVVDDASSDGTLARVTSMNDPRLSVIPMTANRAMNGRNLALRQARGRYVAFQNSDDVWAPGKLAQQISLLSSRRDAAACFTQVEVIGGDDQPVSGTFLDGLFRNDALLRLEWLRLFFDAGNCLCISSAVVRTDLVRRVGGFRGSLVQLSDYDLWVRLATLGELLMVEAPLTRMRHTGGNFGRPSPEGQRRSQIEHVDVLMRYAEFPLARQLHRIFPDVVDRRALPAEAVLALALSRRGRSLRHDLFADRIVARVLDDKAARARAVERHGTGFIHDFLAVRAQLETRLVSTGEAP